MVHHLTKVNKKARRATCSICGRVRVYLTYSYNKGRGKVIRRHSGWRCSNMVKGKNSKHGVSYVEINRMRRKQRNRCVICSKQFKKGKTKGPQLDHCHKSKRIRGLLCHQCNVGLGMFRDNKKLLHNAIRYLTRC